MAAKKKSTTKKTAKATAKTKTETPAPTQPKEDLVVFAFRLTQAERDAIHKTAGPRKATQFVRRVAVAFANESDTEFRAVLKEAQPARD